ncbi:MAG TPA: histidine phosphatase family protein [Mycobacteriales bacterium]|nr:histidine phosphatase family protein [Mycobacteriales bacterium]
MGVLLLIRHAKAVPDAATDELRPLADRGHQDAHQAGRWLAELEISPDLAIVSPATRARETWDEIAAVVGASELQIEPRVYENTVDDLLRVISEVSDDVTTLALVGHNPSMHGLAITLDDGNGDDDARQEIHHGYPTCGITVFDVTRSWSALATGDALLHTFAAPRG